MADYDVVRVLRRQHADIRRAFRQAARPGPGRGAAFGRLVRLLAVHEAAEEAHVHPAVRRAMPAGPAVTAARRREEEQAKRLLARLSATGPDGSGYVRGLLKLRRLVLSHAAREEREEFPALMTMSGPRRVMLGVEVKLAKLVAPTRPHPAVNGELANKLAMPVFGPADRGRDLLSRIAARRGR
jgi:Hemerythrin HHE cation binding domain